MSRGGFEARRLNPKPNPNPNQIMKVTEHKSPESLKTYDQDNSSSAKRDISAFLSTCKQNPSVSGSSTITSTMSTTQLRGQNVFNISGNFYAQNDSFSNE